MTADEEVELEIPQVQDAAASVKAQNLTPFPSDFQHVKILLKRTFQKDIKSPKMAIIRLVMIPFFFAIWNIGIIIDEKNEDFIVRNGYQISLAGEQWEYPAKMKLAGSNQTFVENIQNLFEGNIEIDLPFESNATADQLQDDCDSTAATDEVCVYFTTEASYTIYFGGKENAFPFQPSLAAAQHAVNEALLKSTSSDAPSIDEVQPSPKVVEVKASSYMLFAIMTILAISLGALMSYTTLVQENVDEVKRSYLLVGVKSSSYMVHWLMYVICSQTVVHAVVMTVIMAVAITPESNGGLIFLTTFLGLIQWNTMMVMLNQALTSDELANFVPILYIILPLAVAIPSSHASFYAPLLSILTVFIPLVGVYQSYTIYAMYEGIFQGNSGYGGGVTGGNIAESGLLGNIIALIVGVIFWISLMYLCGSPGAVKKLRSCVFPWWDSSKEEVLAEDEDEVKPENFEPIKTGSDIVLSVRGLRHTYHPSSLNCNKNVKPAAVLKGLDFDICRGEVFGYLGHNGAGKTTSVHILGTEIKLQNGDVTYHTAEGDLKLDSAENAAQIRKKVGICPQHNTTIQDDLTARETLHLFASLKGCISMEGHSTVEDAIDAEVDRRLEEVKFTSEEDADKPCGTFSGGMQRKVLIAMALLGDPEVVFLDEPTAGLDPYNRRTIWDMITAAKKGRSIILTTHFLDEADVLSDRIGIIKNGKLITCGSPLFLKYNSGVGYTLSFDSNQDVDLKAIVDTAERVPLQIEGQHQWRLQHGSESKFSEVLNAVRRAGGTKVTLDLTSLEQVFLETGKEDRDNDESPDGAAGEENEGEEALAEEQEMPFILKHSIIGLLYRIFLHFKNKREKKKAANATEGNIVEETEEKSSDEVDPENIDSMSDLLAKIWEPRGDIETVGMRQKIWIVAQFMRRNQLRDIEEVLGSIIIPLVLAIAGCILIKVLPSAESGVGTIYSDPVQVDSVYYPLEFFLNSPNTDTFLNGEITLIQEPTSLRDMEENLSSTIGGYFAGNKTLQFADSITPFALQIGASVMANTSSSSGGILTFVQQLPYTAEPGFDTASLIFPMLAILGFQGLFMAIMTVLQLKGENVFSLFRVAGISEWEANQGIIVFKFITSFLPTFIMFIILGPALSISAFGDGGRWLATILLLLLLGFSACPFPLIIGKQFIHTDYRSAKKWLPIVVTYGMFLPYLIWKIPQQLVTDEGDLFAIIGDFLSIWPLFAFQYGISKLLNSSGGSWSNVWGADNRIWLQMILMLIVGTIEWLYLRRICTIREPKTKLSEEEIAQYATPVDVSGDADVNAEREKSLIDDDGINARDLVKVFRIKPTKDAKNRDPIIKQSVKGISYGIKKNEIFALLGPNGAGKTVTMNMLAGQYSPEHGEVALDGKKASGNDTSVDHLFKDRTAGYCPQFDALFHKQSVEEHLKFYAAIRGLNWESVETQDHANSIIRLLGLNKYRDKLSSQLSGGYKRRLSLAVCMIGYPKVMMVDEITTGLDPGARRLIWDVLKPPISYSGYDLPAILLSSHYMDECQQLGTRIGIQIDGQLVTTGSLDRLQERYCNSFFVEVQLDPNTVNDTSEPTLEVFDEHDMTATVYESLPFHFRLQVAFSEGMGYDHTKQLADIFDLLETNKAKLNIKFYSVAMMNLEQIFIDLARQQFEADESVDAQRSLRQSKRMVSQRRLSQSIR